MNKAYNTEPHRTNVRPQHSASLTIVPSTSRDEVMRRLLIELRDQELRKIRTLVRDETVLANEAPGDELDRARRNGDLEFHASLRDLSESRLTAITSTLIRLDEGLFGICEECNEQISLARLQSLPFARYCFDCQKDIEEASRRARSRIVASAPATSLFEPYQPESERIDQVAESGESISVQPSRRRRRRKRTIV